MNSPWPVAGRSVIGASTSSSVTGACPVTSRHCRPSTWSLDELHHLAEGVVGADDPAAAVQLDDAVGGGVEQQPQARLGRGGLGARAADGLERLLPLGQRLRPSWVVARLVAP